jgi:hypothetical protein
MRDQLPLQLEQGRTRVGLYASDPGDRYGLFLIMGPCDAMLKILSSGESTTDDPWEHVSISTEKRCPNWQEMCFVKDLFWGDDDCVIQYHPAKIDYINNHPYVLHLWKPPEKILMPPKWMV